MTAACCCVSSFCVNLSEGNGRASLRIFILKFDVKPYNLDIRFCLFYPNSVFSQSLVYQGLINTYLLLSPRTPYAKPLIIIPYLKGVCKCVFKILRKRYATA